MIQLTKLKPRGDYAYEEGIQMVWTAWTRPRCCFNSDFCRTKGSGIHFVVLVVGIKSEFCCNECESNYKEALEKDSRKTKYFILGIALGFLILLYGIALSNRASAIGIGIIVMGIDVVLLPFTTPETAELLGYQKAKLVGRLLGIWVGFI